MSEPKIIDTEKVTKNYYLNLFRRRYINNGKEFTWDYVSHELEVPCCVSIVSAFSPEKIVFLKQWRPTISDYIYEFPGGMIEKGESIEEAAKRELKEETNLDIEKILLKTQPLYTSIGLSDESCVILVAKVTGEPKIIHNEDSENIEIVNMSDYEINDFIKNSTEPLDLRFLLGLFLWKNSEF